MVEKTVLTALAAVALVIAPAAVAIDASAAPKVPQAPQVHVAAPHVAAPHIAAPHVAAPQYHPQMHVAAPHIAPSRSATPRFSGRATTARIGRSGPAFARIGHGISPRHTARSAWHATHAMSRLSGRSHAASRALWNRHAAHTLASHTATRHTATSHTATRHTAGPAAQVATGAQTAARDFHHGRFDRQHFHRGLVGWAGPVFWPYAYDDFLDYVLLPYDEDDNDYGLFWAYGYDDLFGGIYLPYVYDPRPGYAYREAERGAPRTIREPAATVSRLCGTGDSSFVRLPIGRIADAVQPTDDQRTKLDALAQAEANAEKAIGASCPAQLPTDPIGRLDVVQARLQAMLEAADIVKAPLDDFYKSLNDEQRARFDQLGAVPNSDRHASSERQALTRICGPQSAVPAFPIDQIDQSLRLGEQERAELADLRDAATKAAGIITAACPAQAPLTPPGRLEAMHNRLQALLDAVKTVRPALQRFYASLSDAQKQQFNAMSQRQAAR